MSLPQPVAGPDPNLAIHVWAPAFGPFGGGIAAFSRELAHSLRGQHRLTLSGRDDVPGTWQGLPLLGAGRAPGWLRKLAFALQLAATTFRSRPDLIITTHVNFSPVAWAAKRLLGVPYVIVAHGIDVHEGLSQLRKAAVRHADAVWAVSRWTRERSVRVGAPRERVQLISNTVDEERFSLGDASPALRQRYGVKAGEKVVLTVARLDPAERYKGCDMILQALAAVREEVGAVRYLVAGAGGDRERMERLARELGVSESVTFCGFVADADLPGLYRVADVFAMPSRGEGFGIVFLEALACGTPVLGGNQDGTRDALGDGALGMLVDPDDVGGIARALQQLLRREGRQAWFDPSLLREEGLAAHGRAAFARRVRDALAALDEGAA